MIKLPVLGKTWIACALIVFSSCGKDEIEKPINNTHYSDPNAIVQGLEISNLVIDGSQIIKTEFIFSYGSDGKLNNITGSYEGEEGFNGTWEGEYNYSFEYSNGKLNSVLRKDISSLTSAEGEVSTYTSSRSLSYFYNEQGLVSERKVKEVNSDESVFSYRIELEYDGENRLIKERLKEQDGEAVEGELYLGYKWDGRNVISQASYQINPEGGRMLAGRQEKEAAIFNRFKRIFGGKEGKATYEVIFSAYDDKVNMLPVITLLFGEISGLYLSGSNVGKVISYEDTNNDGVLEEYSNRLINHTYDSKGRPTKYTFAEADGSKVDLEEITISYVN